MRLMKKMSISSTVTVPADFAAPVSLRAPGDLGLRISGEGDTWDFFGVDETDAGPGNFRSSCTVTAGGLTDEGSIGSPLHSSSLQ